MRVKNEVSVESGRGGFPVSSRRGQLGGFLAPSIRADQSCLADTVDASTFKKVNLLFQNAQRIKLALI